ncbi:hypothetical protein MMC21_003281 [Puttea exsequens]|nr:hypothetical protein [Puttea exsequens]
MADAMLLARQAASMRPVSAPYPPKTAALGGVPSINPDVPICAVFLVLYIIAACSHMTILQINQHRKHKFIMSGMMFGYCMSRIVTMIMRIVWATRPMNVRIAIAANIFVFAGVVLLFVVNLLFAQRIVRACHPHSGWHPFFHWIFVAIYAWIPVTLVMLLISVIQSFYTLNANTKRIDRDIQLYGQTAYAFISFLPIPMIILGLLVPRKTRVEKFGHGRFRTKIYALTTTTILLCLGACFRLGTNFAGGERPRTDPASYQSKAYFYVFNFVVELVVIYLYLVLRVDKRFFIPTGSHQAGDYLRRDDYYTRKARGEVTDPNAEAKVSPGDMILSEEEVFDDLSRDELERMTSSQDVEKGYEADEAKVPSDAAQRALDSGTATVMSRSLVAIPPVAHTPNERIAEMRATEEEGQ